MSGWFPRSKELTKICMLASAAKRCMSQSYYDILKVPHSCSSKDVKDAFISLSKQNHPDKHGNDPSMHERFVQINEAYSVLINPTSRRAYDMTLGAKRKLNAPYYTTKSSYNPSQHSSPNKKQSRSSSYTSSSGSASRDYFYASWDKQSRTSDKFTDAGPYYGIKGLKKVPNSTMMLVVIGFTLIGAVVQWLVIRAYTRSNREKMMEQSHRLGLIHAMAREKARLYGNEYQINALKNTLKTTYDVPGINVDVAGDSEPLDTISTDVDETCEKCKKCKKS